jgi:DNA polymerase III psi subunit
MTFAEYLITVHSEHPKIARMECLVPGCNRSWSLIGSNQGFAKAAGKSHCASHWSKYHEQQQHPRAVWKDSTQIEHASHQFCGKCKEASEEEYKRRCEKRR